MYFHPLYFLFILDNYKSILFFSFANQTKHADRSKNRSFILSIRKGGGRFCEQLKGDENDISIDGDAITKYTRHNDVCKVYNTTHDGISEKLRKKMVLAKLGMQIIGL